MDRSAENPQVRPRYHFPAISVTGERQVLSRTLQPIHYDVGRWQTNEEVNWEIANLAGSFVKSYGGPGALQTLSVGGGASAHTVVLMDGIPLNSPQSGGLDLATIPLGRIGQMEYLPHGGSSIYGSSALSGVVSLTPKMPRTGALVSRGSYGLQRLEGSLGRPGKSAGVTFGQQTYEGRFPYVWRGESHVRENNHFQQQYLQARGVWSRRSLRHTLSTWVTKNRRGVPGTADASNPAAAQDDLWALASAATTWTGARSLHRWQAYLQQQQLDYQDPRLFLDARHHVTVWGVIYEHSRIWRAGRTSLTRVEGRLERLRSTAAGEHTRGQWSLVQQLHRQVTPWLVLLPIVRLTESPGHGIWVTGDVALQLQPRRQAALGQVTVVASRNLRPPGFNDRYWIPGGNPDLRPESSLLAGLKSRWRVGNELQLDGEVYHTSYTDLIQWVPDADGVWHPGNIHSARATTWIIALQGNLLDGRAAFRAGWDGVFSENLDDGFNRGKPLRYTSRHAGRVQVEGRLAEGWTLAIMGSGRSCYVTTYNYPYDDTLPGWWTWDGCVRWVLGDDDGGKEQCAEASPSRGFSAALTFSIINIVNVMYETIPGYPQPGRTVNLTLQIERN